MRGSGSEENGPGQGLLENMYAPKRAILKGEDWRTAGLHGDEPDNPDNLDSIATLTILDAAWIPRSVSGAIWNA
ncbi:MAG: hypothetical protein M1832_003502 [Thelocarpon impressellum]|nr:MAG: hypothetical protein M1832_003502 [Thelocarpon impressellum]